VSTQDNSNNLESIARTVKRANISKDFALIFAECNSLDEQEKYVEKLREKCSQEGIVLTEVKLLERPPVKRLLPVVKEHLAKTFNDGLPERLGIQITGLELSILLDEDEQAPAVLQILNMNRESYYQDMPYPFIFWLPEYACIKVANAAPDFWSIQVGSVTFSTAETQQSILMENIASGKNITAWQDKLSQIPVLERLLDTLKSPGVRVDLLVKSADAYYYIGKIDRARQRYEQAIKENQKAKGKPQRVAEAYNKLGLIYSDLGANKDNLEKAEKSLRQFLDIVEQEHRTDLLTMGYNHMGLVYDKHRKYHQALQAYKKAQEISRRHGHRRLEGDVLGNMGLLYRKQKKFEDALNMHKQALGVSREMNDVQGEVLDLSNIGLIYHEQNQHEKAIDYYTQALLINRRVGNKLEEMNQLIHMGDAWKALENFSKALENYQLAKVIAEEINIDIFTVLERQAALYGPGGIEDREQEILLLKEAIEKSRQMEKSDKELQYWERLCEIYRKRNEIIDKSNSLMQMEALIKKQIQDSENEDKRIEGYEKLLKIYEDLNKNKELKACKKKLEELNERHIIVWFEPDTVAMEKEQPVVQVGKAYQLNLRVVQKLPTHPLVYQVKIPYFKEHQRLTNMMERPIIEGRRISEDRIERSTKKNTTLEGDIKSGVKEFCKFLIENFDCETADAEKCFNVFTMKIRSPLTPNDLRKNFDTCTEWIYKKDAYWGTKAQALIHQEKEVMDSSYPDILQEKREKINKVRSPSPPPYISDPFAIPVSFQFKSSGFIFDQSDIEVLLSENNISNVGSVSITPKSKGYHSFYVKVLIETFGYTKGFEIPFQAVQKKPSKKTSLEKFRDLKLHLNQMLNSPQERGRRFESWLIELFQASGLKSEGSFTRNASNEEFVGVIHEGLNTFLLEAKWQKSLINAQNVRIFHNKIQRTIGTYGILISVSGFNEDAIHIAEEMIPIRLFLIDMSHLEALLEQKINGKTWINTLVKIASLYEKSFISVEDILKGEIVKTLNIRIDRSKEETEALLQVIDEDEAIAMEVSDADLLFGDNSLLVHKNLKKSLQVVMSIPARGRKGIKEDSDTKLFTLALKNNCSTRTGSYRWEIKGNSVEGDTHSHIEFEKDPLTLFPNETSGTITDHRDDQQEIEFWLDPAKIKKVHTYNFSFKVRYSIGIQLYPAGETGQGPAGGEKQIDFSIEIQCFHDVKDNYLVVDFGSSAICAYYYTLYPETLGQNCVRIPLQSPMYQLPSEDDLLPSIINLRNVVRDGINDAETVREVDDPGKMAVAGTEHFVDLPARKDIFAMCPDTVLSSIKLLVVQGVKIAPIPGMVSFGLFGEKRPFNFIDENGEVKQGYPTLKSILKSCYKYLLKNYIDKYGKFYRKVVLTYPNVYNYSHISFLQDQVFKEIFQESGRVYFENIGMESESNSVLYYYLSRRKTQEAPNVENVMVIDIGAGIMNMSYAKIEWEKWAQDAVTPKHIEIIKRDGIAMAGDSLDKAIALQVHSILKKFTQFEDVDYANKIATNGELDLSPERKHTLKKVMFALKIKHILDFKKTMAESDNDDYVDICLGENDKQNGLCEVRQELHEISLVQDPGESINVTLKNKFGKLYIGMTKKDWLNLPYLKRFEHLLIEKLGAFTNEIDIPNDLTIVMSGRTSLWPAVSKAVRTVFTGVNINMAEDIWPSDITQKALELKRAVILGAVQKATTWKGVEFKENIIAGVEAVRYQKGADGSKPSSWSIKTFPRSSEPSLTINLANSSYFELGIKTSMDFVPFTGADSYKRDDYCLKDKVITITLGKLQDTGDYHFFVKSDKYQKGKGTRLTHILSQETAFLRTRTRYWPVKDAQLREIEPEEFNENV
jgi:tetratricopeptide (TPR) repeat protein